MDFMESLEDLGIELEFGKVPISMYVKNVLVHANYAKPITFCKITAETSISIEDFVGKLLWKIIPNDAKKKDYYSYFYKDEPQNFKFLPGDNVLILELIEIYKKKLTTKKTDAKTPVLENVLVESSDMYNVVDSQKFTVLRLLIESARSRAEAKNARGFRYDYILKLFSAYIFIVGGRILYDTLRENLAFLSPSAISRFICEDTPHQPWMVCVECPNSYRF